MDRCGLSSLDKKWLVENLDRFLKPLTDRIGAEFCTLHSALLFFPKIPRRNYSGKFLGRYKFERRFSGEHNMRFQDDCRQEDTQLQARKLDGIYNELCGQGNEREAQEQSPDFERPSSCSRASIGHRIAGWPAEGQQKVIMKSSSIAIPSCITASA